jgi:hypothetical protein
MAGQPPQLQRRWGGVSSLAIFGIKRSEAEILCKPEHVFSLPALFHKKISNRKIPQIFCGISNF